MDPDSPPDDVRLTGDDLSSIRERRAAIRRPGHLPDTRLALNTLTLSCGADDWLAKPATKTPSALRKARRC